jgi:hypothetical protein
MKVLSFFRRHWLIWVRTKHLPGVAANDDAGVLKNLTTHDEETWVWRTASAS